MKLLTALQLHMADHEEELSNGTNGDSFDFRTLCLRRLSKVSSTLHTPLMSGANAIHGVILVGAIIVADHSKTNLELGLSVAAIILATINMVGGFVVTDRMLEMFKGNKK